jgi:hypothetical protein
LSFMPYFATSARFLPWAPITGIKRKCWGIGNHKYFGIIAFQIFNSHCKLLQCLFSKNIFPP